MGVVDAESAHLCEKKSNTRENDTPYPAGMKLLNEEIGTDSCTCGQLTRDAIVADQASLTYH